MGIPEDHFCNILRVTFEKRNMAPRKLCDVYGKKSLSDTFGLLFFIPEIPSLKVKLVLAGK